jgi:ribosomal protein S18 acetylase RimI-like enzyme
MAQIIYDTKLDKTIEDKMEKSMIQYESEHGIDVNYQRFYLICSNDASEVVGVLNAYTAFSEIYIDDLWVDDSNRKKGYGLKLIKTLEERFMGKGYNNINLVTSAFQAPGFYKKCGFYLEYTRENKQNPKLTKYFFVKFFSDNNQTQGLLK